MFQVIGNKAKISPLMCERERERWGERGGGEIENH
jgi:hypothetical protein